MCDESINIVHHELNFLSHLFTINVYMYCHKCIMNNHRYRIIFTNYAQIFLEVARAIGLEGVIPMQWHCLLLSGFLANGQVLQESHPSICDMRRVISR